MTKDEMTKLLAVMESVYPNHFKKINHKDTLAIWLKLFENDNSTIITMAVRAYISTDTKGFPPVPGQIKEIAYKLTHEKEMTEGEAWQLIKKAIKKVSMYDKKKTWSAYDELPKTLRDMTSPSQLIEWAYYVPSESLETVVASNFMRAFKARQKAERDFYALPENAKKLTEDKEFKNLLEGMSV